MRVEELADVHAVSTRAMASAVTIQLPRAVAKDRRAVAMSRRALDVFHEVEAVATRFVATSPLMRANATPTRWRRVPPLLYRALEEAYDQYQRTEGLFDPRVGSDLVDLGYDASMRFGVEEVRRGPRVASASARPTWVPGFRSATSAVCLGDPVDLGGIGKGLAVRWASAILAPVCPDFLIDAGGDCYVAGHAGDDAAWRVGVEDPLGDATPLAVLALRDRAVATSSTRRRRWRVGEEMVHHLIDPRTRRSGGEGLAAVSVVGADPARAEVDAKVLFLAGRARIAQAARAAGVAALWCDEEGRVGRSAAMAPYVMWERS